MAGYLALDVKQLEREIDAILTQYPELTEDEELRADVLEGETEIDRVASRVIRRMSLAKASVSGIKDVISDLRERERRLKREEDAMHELLKSILSAAGLEKLTLPEATISITKPRESVEVIDVNELPQGMYKIERVPDKIAIAKSIKDGECVPGAMIVRGEAGVTVRIK